MNKLHSIYALLALAVLFAFASCAEEEKPGLLTGKTVSLELPVEALEMQQAGGGVPTRWANDALEMVFGEDAATTRANKDPQETDIKMLYLVQFNGTAPESTVVKSGVITRDAVYKATTFDFSAVDAVCRVYIVANVNQTVVDGTTLEDFEESMVAYTATTAIDTNVGIPMCDYKDFNPMTVPQAPRFSMTAMVAKLTVTYNVDAGVLPDFEAGTTVTSLDVALKNIASGTAYPPTATPATAYRPMGISFLGKSIGKTGTTHTYYVPENVAGNSTVNITDWKKRSIKNAPANALYFEITGRNVTNNGTIIIASFPGDPAKPNEFNINRNYAYTLTATVRDVLTGSVDERVTMAPDLDLNTDLGLKYANCYVITDNFSRKYEFDATKRGNNSTVSGINVGTLPDLTTATEARVLWQTGGVASVISSVSLVGGKVVYTTGSATEGNAVIGIFASGDPAAECLWSWHIWKLNGDEPSDVACTKTPSPASASANFQMMDRNLGAYNNTEGNVGSIGLFYQWGRKDPFPGPGGFSTVEPTNIYGSYNKGGTTGSWNGGYSLQTVSSATGGTEAWVTKYPTIFIDGSNSGNWLAVINNSLWGTPWVAANSVNGYNGNQGIKSIYDPCPVGYRVPPHDTWNNEPRSGTYRNNGGLFGGMATDFWFPATGLRNVGNGTLHASPRYACYWSSSSMSGRNGDPNAGYMIFNNTLVVTPNSGSGRAYGLPVRCVSE